MRISLKPVGFVLMPALLAAVLFQTPAFASGDATANGATANATGDYATDVIFGPNGAVTSVRAFNTAGEEIPVPADAPLGPAARAFLENADHGGVQPYKTGGGGTPSASGCQTVTLNNEKESSIFGETLWWFHTSTYWCWNASSFNVYNVSIPSPTVTDIDPSWSFEGYLNAHTGWYSYYPGQGSSGYFNDLSAHFQQCVGPICTNDYPRNQLWSFYDGTWQWQTDD